MVQVGRSRAELTVRFWPEGVGRLVWAIISANDPRRTLMAVCCIEVVYRWIIVAIPRLTARCTLDQVVYDALDGKSV